MIAERPVRALLIVLCMVLLYLPTRMYFHSPPEYTVVGVLSSGFPVWLFLFGYLCVREGIDRGRAREQADQGKRPVR